MEWFNGYSCEEIDFFSGRRYSYVMNNIRIDYCDYHGTNALGDRITRPSGGDDYLFLFFHTPMEIKMGRKITSIQPGGCILYTPGTPQDYWAIREFTNSFVHFQLLDSEAIKDCDFPVNEVFYPRHREVIDRLLQQLYVENSERAPHYEEMQNLILRQIFMELSRQSTEAVEGIAADIGVFHVVKNARREILTHPTTKWNVESMAALTHMGVSQFYHYYTKFFEKSPKAELLEVRLERAKYLLLNESLTVSQVALHSGFQDTSHFIRYFKKHVGVTPLQYKLEQE